MKTPSLRSLPGRSRFVAGAFSLVEVVLALAICSFALVSVMGLFMAGLQANRESEGEIQAANLASLIISSTRSAPLEATNSSNPIPSSSLTNSFSTVYSNQYVGWDGMLTNSSNAAYQITCRSGTNTLTGSGVAQVYLLLSWPIQASASTPSHYYEISTYIPVH